MEEVDNTDERVLQEPAPSCTLHGQAACEVEILESWSRAIIRVVETVAPAVVSITSRMTFRVYRFLTEWPAGKPVKVAILRLGERLEIDVRPGEAASAS